MAFVLLFTTVASLALLVVGLMGLTGRLPRNHFAGIRTRATLASDEAWREGHRLGSAPLIFAAVAALMAGVAFLPFAVAGKVGGGVAAAVAVGQAAVILVGAVIAWPVANRAARAAG